jgi:ABC-type multidrug transport system ATPase subunit
VFLEGMDVTTQTLAVRHRIGMVSQDDHFDRYLSIWHNLTLHAQMHGMPRSQYDPVIADWLDRLGLYARRHDAPDTLSGGMKRRVSLIRALIHRPSVLFLDEPTTGLDPQARREIWDTICAFKSHATILLTTHYMEEAEYLSDHILLMNHGEVVKQGTAASLKRDISPDDVFELVLERPVAEETQAKLAGVSGVVHIHLHDPFRLSVTLARGVHLGELMQHLHPADIQRIGRQQADLEQVFLSVAGRKQQAAEGSSGQQACLPP